MRTPPPTFEQYRLPDLPRCRYCGAPIKTGATKPLKYCDARCRLRAHRARRGAKKAETNLPALPHQQDDFFNAPAAADDSRNPPKSRGEIRFKQGGTEPRIIGPARVLAREVAAGTWRTVTSADGVVSEVTRLRPGPLIRKGVP